MRIARAILTLVLLPVVLSGAVAGQARSTAPKGGTDRIVFLSMFESASDVEDSRTPCQRVRDYFDRSHKTQDLPGEKPALCDKVVDVIAGKAGPSDDEPNSRLRAAKIVTDSRRRIVLTEPGTRSVHILDFASRKYTRIDGRGNDRMHFPYGVAVDADDNVYVTDQRRGTIAVFNAEGKFKRFIGDFDGEHAFEQPNCVAIDRATGRLYLTDTSRQFLLIYDRKGNKIASVGKRGGGTGPAEFRLPTELALHAQEVFVLDKRNRRIQVLDLEGRYKREIRTDALGSEAPKGMAIDTQGRIYILLDVGLIEVFSPTGERLFRFGHYGAGAGEFKESSGIYIDSADRLYVSDTGNRRVQIFQIKR